MSNPRKLFTHAISRLRGSQDRKRSRRRPSRRLRTEALEARQLLAADICINEIMADNDAAIEDPQEVGAFEDWIELYNTTDESIDLSGKFLTDDLGDPDQWQFPEGSTIAAGDYLLIWADGDTDQGDNHASFKLSSGGETVALYDTDGATLLDSIEFGAQLTDVSYGRSPDGGDTLGSLSTATPGAVNSSIVETNIAPSADAGGPYFGTTADTISLSASASEDSDGNIASYAWDLDNDGVYDDATGVTASYTSTTEGTFVVGLQVTDDDGETIVDTGTIKISQVGDEASPWDAVTIDDEAAAFFDDTYVHEIRITFEDDDWYDTLFHSHDTDVDDPYFIADFVADGVAVDGVGVRFKGNSSFEGTGVKKSFKIDFNEFDDLTFLGLKKLNLNNNYNDPTMLREKLFYDYASNFVEGVGRAVHTNLYVNGELYGIYTAVEQIDSTFTESRFGDDEDGNLYKGTASDDAVLDDPSADFGSDLTYLGTDQADYEAFYELKTNETANDYSQLIEFIDVLSNTPTDALADAIEPLLDVDDTLASLALNNLFVNLDSYIGAAHNYYVYDRDDTGQFTHLFWDVNESFGTFTQFLERGQDPVEIDPFWLPVSTTPAGAPRTTADDESRPLAENLWAVDEYSTSYLRDLAQMLEEGFDVTSATARINELADLIRDDVTADPNKQFTTAEFERNLTTDVSTGRRTIYGLTGFIEDRSTFLVSALSQYDLEPASVEISINEIMADNDATIEDPDEAGAFEDWIELYNPGAEVVDLSGLYLTDDAEDPTQWEFPDGSTIDAGGYLVIWADDDTDQGDTHASFKLSAGGESVLLYNTDGETLVDSVTFGEQTTDISYGRFPDGSDTLTVLSAATPGAANTNDAFVENVAPIADAGGPYTATVGDTITLGGATSSDSDGEIVAYAWDLDNDGQYETSGVTPRFSAATTGTFTVGLQVTDDDGATSFDTATVTVEAVPDAPVGTATVEISDGTLLVVGIAAGAIDITVNDNDQIQVTDNGELLGTFDGVVDLEIELDQEPTGERPDGGPPGGDAPDGGPPEGDPPAGDPPTGDPPDRDGVDLAGPIDDFVTIAVGDYELGSVEVDLGGGNNSLVLASGEIDGTLLYFGLEGNDSVVFKSDSTVEGDVILELGAGDDIVEIFGEIEGDAEIHGDDGNDLATVATTADLDGSLLLEMGDGTNAFVSAGEVQQLIYFGGANDDSITVSPASQVQTDARISVDAGTNSIDVLGLVDGTLTLVSANDQEAFTVDETLVGALSVNLGVEGDHGHDHDNLLSDGINIDLFLDGALAEEPQVVACTLSDGTETDCYEITVVGEPVDHEVGPFCPVTTSTTADDAGIWFDGNEVYDLDGAFILGLADLYGDDNWMLFNEDGTVNVTDSLEAFEAAARPDVAIEFQNFCVEGQVEFLDGGHYITSTVLIPVQPVPVDTPIIPGNWGVTLNGVNIAQSAPVDAILSAYTIAAFDDFGGHINPVDGYHLHGVIGTDGEAFNEDHSGIIGYALDGYPIFVPLEEGDPDFDELDEYGGHFTEGIGYHYHANPAEENSVLTALVGAIAVSSDGTDDGGGPDDGGPPIDAVNVAPVAAAGGTYSGIVSETISLTGAASIDSDGTVSTYAWDLDSDGEYDDATGVRASFSAVTAGTFTVGLLVTDDGGLTSTDTATVTVSNSPTRIVTPDFVVRPHVISGGDLPTAIIFQAFADTDISVVAVGTASLSQDIRIVDENVAEVGNYSGGVITASVTDGQSYAIIFGSNSNDQIYSVQSTFGTDAFTPNVATNFLQPTDTNGDSVTSALDALVVINELRANNIAEGELLATPFMNDVNKDDKISAIDALLVINELRRKNFLEAEQSSISLAADSDLSFESSVPAEGEFVPLDIEQPNGMSAALLSGTDADAISLDAQLTNTNLQTTSVMSADDSRSLAVAELVGQASSTVSEDDLDLLAADLCLFSEMDK